MANNPSKNKNIESREEESAITSNYLTGNYPINQVQLVWKRKTAWLFLLFGVAIVFLVGWYLKTQVLEGPLAYNVPAGLQEQLNNKNQEELVADLKKKDTDQDGLNDYQEIYQFHTSIFLADSDSDGFSDYQEANSGNDPLCPTGEDCNLLRLITPNTKLAEIVEEVALDPNLTLQQATLNQLRVFLVANGVPQADVDVLSDDDLLLIYAAWAEENKLAGEVNFSELSSEEVRQFLLNQPNADVEAINKLSEQELIDIRNSLVSQ